MIFPASAIRCFNQGGIASDGHLVRPHVVDPKQLPADFQQAVLDSFPGSGDTNVHLNPDTWVTITDGMAAATTVGTIVPALLIKAGDAWSTWVLQVSTGGQFSQRLADILTDTFRAQILRILGYRVNVMEFVAPEATARNLLLRAEYSVKPGQQQAIGEYLELRDLWQVKPYLETRLAARLEKVHL